MGSPTFLVGIDLGTTNTVVAFAPITDTLSDSPIEIFPIDQLIDSGKVARKSLLPSFRYHPTTSELSPQDLQLPWENTPVNGDISHCIIGEWARELGSKVEGRQVNSAKSWLSHNNVDRTEAILPWNGGSSVDKVSPIIASASYLNHVRLCWNYHHPDALLEDQDVVITVPASFDESARAFTLEAAQLAHLPKIHLLEEPQAACYDWYHQNKDQAEHLLENIERILVCDIGGGTTDLSLIDVEHHADHTLKLNRIGVGDHLMLGGDNLDLALAHQAEKRLSDTKLSAAALSKLIQQTRKVKERLLSDAAPKSAKVTLLGSGSKLIGGAKSIMLSQKDTQTLALDGFLPITEWHDLPKQRQSAILAFGLPYASDPAISKHLAQFLQRHTSKTGNAIPQALLLNGGVFNSPQIVNRLQAVFSHWSGQTLPLLCNPHPDLAVAYGAVAYAKARRGAQLKIGGGSPRGYFLVIDNKRKDKQGICLLPKGTEEDQEITLAHRKFALTLGEPVRFNLVSTTDEWHGAAGDLIDIDESNFITLPPFIATLEGNVDRSALLANQKERQEVTLACQLTEVGTLKIDCINIKNTDQRWNVEFAIRQKSDDIPEENDRPQNIDKAIELIKQAYGSSKNTNDDAIKNLQGKLEKLLGKRDTWAIPSLRTLATALLESRKRRRRSDLHERTWLKLTGFCLRPGFGAPADEWRMKEVWGLYQQGIQFDQNPQTWGDWWNFWRRISGGLTTEQQMIILKDIGKYISPNAMRDNKLQQAAQSHQYEDMVKLAASLEHLPFQQKLQLIESLFSRLQKNQHAQAHWWAIGRIATRSPFYGSQHNLLTGEHIAYCLPELMAYDWRKEPSIAFAAVMMTRMTGDRKFDLNETDRVNVIQKLKNSRAPQSWIDMVSTVKVLTESETKRVFGDALPNGLRLIG